MFFLQVLLNSLAVGSQTLLLVLSLYIIYSTSKIINLSIGVIGTAVAYWVYFGISQNLSWLVILFLLTILVGIFTLVIHHLFEPFIQKKEEVLAMLASISLFTVIQSLVSIIFGAEGKFIIQKILPVVEIGNLHVTTPGLLSIVFCVLVIFSFVFLFKKTTFGRIFKGLAENESLAKSIAVDVYKTRFVVLFAAIFITSTVIILYSINTALTPAGSFTLMSVAFIIFLVSGLKKIKGVILSFIFLFLIPDLFIGLSSAELQISENWRMFIIFVLATIVLGLRPHGIAANRQRAN